ncbi:thiamine diphosphokinase [Rossellomorea aquimaris]|uniref:Thiamine diphosphokinase n=1 Tax=Rossellomorea aquimaris TaxID=189382 RepID=A0A366EYQ6_9BACI|nr:thiamine diphosphokinase [Rossellomorea aquimaris]RBP06860.1 thiamine diphosphokinase [Rossellomorea aquimaris]
MIINIVAGGPGRYIPELTVYDGELVKWIGVDRGVYRLLEQSIEPWVAFGDFDSVTDEEWDLIQEKVQEVNRYKPEKDETDLELALNWAIDQNPDKINIFGATGGRLDHFMGNLQLLMTPKLLDKDIVVEIIDVQNRLYLAESGEHSVEKSPELQYISFVPITQSVEGITLWGFKYPLKNRNISRGSTLCISNELIQSSGTFSFSNGILMVIRSSD